MKKYIILLIVIIIASFIGGGTVYFFMSKNLNESEKEIHSEVKNENLNEEKKVNVKDNTKPTYQQNINSSQNTKKTKYTHVAIQGCVITESNPSKSTFTYKKKCESCGYVEPGTISTSGSSGTMSTYFMCPKCKKNQKVQIESSTYYE